MKKLLIISSIFFFFSVHINAQIAMGQWRTHFAYNSVVTVTQSENKVFGIANGALFSVDKNDFSTTRHDKISGLSDNGISYIEFDDTNKQLVIGYSNGNIDLLTNSGIINIPDYYNKILSLNKNINHITIHNNRAFLSCNFGILVLNLRKKEIAESYYIGHNAAEVVVENTTVNNGNIYALAYTETINGQNVSREYNVYYGDLSNPNLINFENWSTLSPLPGTGNFQKLVSFGNKLYLLLNDNLYVYDEGSWASFRGITAKSVSVSNNQMILNINDYESVFLDEQLNVVTKNNIGEFADAIYDINKSDYWFGGISKGIIHYSKDDRLTAYLPEGPALNTSWDLTFSGERLFVAPGGRLAANYGWDGYVMIYENNNWTNIYPETGYPVRDILQITIDPKDENHYFATSYGTGLYEFRNNQLVNWFNAANTEELESAKNLNPYIYTRLDGGVFDTEGNFWFTNTEVEYGIKVMTPTGEIIKVFSNGTSNKSTVGKIFIDQQNPNHKWILIPRAGTGISILNDNGTVENTRDDNSIFHSSFYDSDPYKQGETISPSFYHCIAQEKNGTIWVGTDIGPLLFQHPEQATTNQLYATRIKIPRNDGSGLADLLLENEHVKAIAIDAANRKWLGTQSSGVFLVSENGQETIHHFTAENSPLLSNEIFSIAINPVSGEVFFATGNGLISYQGDAADATNKFENLHVYPNPVRENFEGMITIKGLVENTYVKITDINGNVICETRSNGSIATWDGKNSLGRKVGTGVYLAICISEDGKLSSMAKILVVN